jgi:uncharacterized membrane protein YwaF
MLINGLINWLAEPSGEPANYMYLCGPPKKATLYDLFGPWPWALLPLIGIGTLILALCYTPYWIADALRARRA